ncbi:protein of unknown function [Streptomyces murinus]
MDAGRAARLAYERTSETDEGGECHGRSHHALPPPRRPGVQGLTGSAFPPRGPSRHVSRRNP